MHYYYVCTISPGFVDHPPPEAGHGILWAKKKGPSDRVMTGVRWSGVGSVKVTRAATTKCRKCGQVRPEVSVVYKGRLKADEVNGSCLTL